MNADLDRSARLVIWLVLAGFAAAGAHYALTKSMHHDVAYYVNAVERWLDGARLYRDLIDVNVPTIYWLMTPPVWTARQLGLAPTTVFNWFVIVLAGVSVAAIWYMARRALRTPGLLPEILAGVMVFWIFILVGHNFGQREHLATLLLAPYVVCRAGLDPFRSGTWLRLAIGLAAGIGMALKPFFIFIFLGAEMALLLRRGWRGWPPAAETVGALSASSACAAATIIFVPAYLHDVVPLARSTYHGYEWPLADVLWHSLTPRTFGSFLLALAAVPLAWRLENRTAELVALLAGAAFGGYASFLVQSKGWIYQLTPALAFSSAAIAVAVAGRSQRYLSQRRSPAALAIIGVAVGTVAAGIIADLSRSYKADRVLDQAYSPLIETIRHYAQGGPALFISLDVDYTFPGVNYAGAAYPYRWHHLLPMSGLYRDFMPGPDGRLFRAPSEMGPIERAFFDSFVADARANPPRLVMIDRRRAIRPGLSPDLDLFAYFCQSPDFAELMRGYDWLGRRAPYDVLVPRPHPAGGGGPCAQPRPELELSQPARVNGPYMKEEPQTI
jgi:hypothetical protein